jgi:3-oxoadipate enol-lactonase
VMDVAHWPRAHICGISIGAMTAMWLGAHAPDRVNRLVLSNTSAKGHSEVYAQRMVQVRDHGLSSICDGTMGRFFMPAFVQQANPYFLGLREVFLQGDPRGYIACCAALRDMDLRDVLPTICAKSLVIIGEYDQGTTPDMGELIAKSIPGASSVVMPYAHIPILEDPEGYLALVRNFLLKT